MFPELTFLRVAMSRIDYAEDVEALAARWLCGGEGPRFADLKHAGRRREWIGARRALKSLLIEDRVIRAPQECEIVQNNLGRPSLRMLRDGRKRSVTACSLAHKPPFILVGYGAGAKVRIGVDVERVALRVEALRHRFEAEGDKLLRDDPEGGYSTVLWALKEAASKAVGLGLGIGFRKIQCREKTPGRCTIELQDGKVMDGSFIIHDGYVLCAVTDNGGGI